MAAINTTNNRILMVNSNKLNFQHHIHFIGDTDKIVEKLKDAKYNSGEKSSIVSRKQIIFGKSEPWPDFVKKLKNLIEKYMVNQCIITEDQRVKTPINCAVLNYYSDGSKYIGWHQDDEKDLRKINGETLTVSLSFGVARDFVFRRKDASTIKHSIKLEEGDLLIVRGETNSYWEHTLPKRLRVKKPCWNLTFRFM